MAISAAATSASTKFEEDLASLACQAAVELDSLVLKRASTLQAVKRLIEDISDSVSNVDEPTAPTSLLDPSTAVAINFAMRDSEIRAGIKQLDELVREAKNLTRRLAQLIEDPEKFRDDNLEDLEKMRSFCLSLSKYASQIGAPIFEGEPNHPIRR